MGELKVRPISGSNNRVWVEPAPAETKTASGLIIPDSAKEKPQYGIVRAVSDDSEDKKPTVKVGDKVLYGKYSGTEIKYQGVDYLIMKESDILAII